MSTPFHAHAFLAVLDLTLDGNKAESIGVVQAHAEFGIVETRGSLADVDITILADAASESEGMYFIERVADREITSE